MRLSVFLLAAALASAQGPGPLADPSYEPRAKAYDALRDKKYDEAIGFFLKSIELAPSRAAVRKDLAYTYLKTGQAEAARDQFAEAMRLDPKDLHVALEYAFLCNDTRQVAKARRVFDRIRQSGDPESRATAGQAFQNIDGPLAAGIARWGRAVELAPDKFTGHHELAGIAEQRDELDLALEHYLKAWQLLPARKSLLLDLGRVWAGLNRVADANAAYLAASRSGDPRTSEEARDHLPSRYPYASEFRAALALDQKNVALRRELAFLLMAVKADAEALSEFRHVTEEAPEDLVSAAQLGLLYLEQNDKARAMPLLQRVMNGSDRVLASRVKEALKIPEVKERPAPAVATSAKPKESGKPQAMAKSNARLLGEKSLEAGYLNDAVKYLRSAYETDPNDSWVALKLGWTYNMLHDDREAMRWFELARQSPDLRISAEAKQAYNNLRPNFAGSRTTVWVNPFFSTRWHDMFGYGQIKTDWKLGKLPLRPYISTRFFGDTRQTTGGPLPQHLSDSAAVVGAGIATPYWRGTMAWAEAGTAIRYLSKAPGLGRMTPDYRGGVSYAKGFGHLSTGDGPGLFFEMNADGIFVSRYNNDSLLSLQNKAGFTMPELGGLQTQFFWNANLITDVRRLEWANFGEFGPGLRFRWRGLPRSLMFSVSGLRGYYIVQQTTRGPHFYDLRVGLWYAITH